jgi:TetR/AcrR family transcriptional regulator, cholesterol catabolism regulator
MTNASHPPATGEDTGVSVRNAVMRERITGAAARLFQTRGVSAVSMQEVAAEVGLSKAALYHYYQSREDLLRHIFGDWARGEVEHAREIAESSDDAATKLAAFVRLHLNSLVDNLDLYSLSFREEAQLPEDVREEFRALKRENDILVRQIIREGVEAGIFEPVDETLAVFAIVGMCNWMWKWYRPGVGKNADEIAETFSHLVLHGLMTDASAIADGWADGAGGAGSRAGALAYHARAIRHHTRQLELLLPRQ